MAAKKASVPGKGSRSREAASAAGRSHRILLIHGVGQPVAGDWSLPLERRLGEIFASDFPDDTFLFDTVTYQDIFEASFEANPLDPGDFARALTTLGWSGIQRGLADLFRRSRGIDSLTETLKWTAGMTVRWADDTELRARLRRRVAERIAETKPDAIAAHSLGSLVAYDTFIRDQNLVAGRIFISFGSQIGNAFVRNVFDGRLRGLRKARYWFHLYNGSS